MKCSLWNHDLYGLWCCALWVAFLVAFFIRKKTKKKKSRIFSSSHLKRLMLKNSECSRKKKGMFLSFPNSLCYVSVSLLIRQVRMLSAGEEEGASPVVSLFFNLTPTFQNLSLHYCVSRNLQTKHLRMIQLTNFSLFSELVTKKSQNAVFWLQTFFFFQGQPPLTHFVTLCLHFRSIAPVTGWPAGLD